MSSGQGRWWKQYRAVWCGGLLLWCGYSFAATRWCCLLMKLWFAQGVHRVLAQPRT